MYRLYEAQSNCMNYLIIEDTANNRSCVIDWDLSDDEISEQIKNFESGQILKDLDPECWEPDEGAFSGTFARKYIACFFV